MSNTLQLIDRQNINDEGIGHSVRLTFSDLHQTTIDRFVSAQVADGFTLEKSYPIEAILGS